MVVDLFNIIEIKMANDKAIFIACILNKKQIYYIFTCLNGKYTQYNILFYCFSKVFVSCFNVYKLSY